MNPQQQATGQNAAARSAAGGSHGGRGFRYQDGVAAAVAVMYLVGELTIRSVSCEYLEDIHLVTNAGPVHAQVKSRRPHLAPHTVGWVAAQVAALIRRHKHALDSDPTCTVALVVESITNALEPTGWSNTVTSGSASYTSLANADAFYNSEDALDPTLLHRVHLVHAPRPRADAVNRLHRARALLPAVAEVCVASLRQALADAADASGEAGRTKPASLSATELQRLFDRAVETVDARSLSQALLDGTAEALDLVTPIDDSQFPFGVDVEPGHLAAGNLHPREGETQLILQGLDKRRSVLVAGPSGAGKSALTWLAAAETAEKIVWYRIRRLDGDAVTGLVRLARGLRAGTNGMKVGFIVDDAGRVPGPWDALVTEAAARPGLYVLGSIRAEDLPLLHSTHRSHVVRPVLDEALAAAIYQRLAGDGITQWAGWREAFDLSGGLLLEYTHILIAGARLDQTIAEQVHVRLDDPTRHGELQVLRLVGLAASYGCTIHLDRLRDELQLSEDALSATLHRLYDEHLIRLSSRGTVGGLHELRSAAVVRATHALGSPTIHETARRLLRVLDGEDLTIAVAAVLEPAGEGVDVLRAIDRSTSPSATSLLELDEVHEALTAHLRTRPEAVQLAAALQGLRIAAFRRTAHAWSRAMDEIELPRTLRQTAVPLAFTATDVSSLPLDPAVSAAIQRIRAQPKPEFRDGMEGVAEDVLETASKTASIDAAELVLLAAAGWSIPPGTMSRFASTVAARHDHASLRERTALLIAARAHAPATAAATATALGGEPHLLAAYVDSHPWLFEAHRTTTGAEQAVRAKLLYIDTSAVNRDFAAAFAAYGTDNAHDAVVAACRDLLALQPSATIARVAAVGADGRPCGYGDFTVADKAIPRDNLPPDAEIAWNRLQTATVAALSGDTSATARLAAEAAVTDQLTTALTNFLNYWVCGAYDRATPPPAAAQATTRLADLHREAAALPSPVLPVSLGILLRRYADPRRAAELPPTSSTANLARLVITNLAPRLLQHDEKLMWIAAFAGDNLLQQINALNERPDWELIADPPRAQLMALALLMRDLHDVLAEAAASDDRQQALKQLRETATGSHPLAAAANAARQAAEERAGIVVARLQSAIAADVASLPVQTQIITRARDDRYGVTWPAQDIAVIARTDNPLVILQLLPAIQAARRGVLTPSTSLSVLGAVQNQIAPSLTYWVFENSIFPRPDEATLWQPRAQLSILDAPTYVAAAEAKSGLYTLSALSMLRTHRPLQPTEQAVADQAAAQLRGALYRLADAANAATDGPLHSAASGDISLSPGAAETVPGRALLTINDWCRSVHTEGLIAAGEPDVEHPSVPSGPGGFARRVAAASRGEDEELASAMTLIHFALLVHDIDPDRARQVTAEWLSK